MREGKTGYDICSRNLGCSIHRHQCTVDVEGGLDASQTITVAMDSGETQRAAWSGLPQLRLAGVSIVLGSTAFAVVADPATSAAVAWMSACSAAFDAVYAAMLPEIWIPARDPTAMIRPADEVRICGRNSRMA
jgi:hypothetical protein